MEIMVETYEGMDKEIELKDNKIKFLINKKEISDGQIIHETEQVNLIQLSDKTDRVLKE